MTDYWPFPPKVAAAHNEQLEVRTDSFVTGMQRLLEWKRTYGHVYVHEEDDHELAAWLDRQRAAYAGNKLSEEHCKWLDRFGVDIDPDWTEMYDTLLLYVIEHGDAKVDERCLYRDRALGIWLGQQIKELRAERHTTKHLRNAARVRRLNELEIDWDPDFSRLVDALDQWHRQHGNWKFDEHVVFEGRNLKEFCYEVRWLYHRVNPEGERVLAPDQVHKLLTIGFDFALDSPTTSLLEGGLAQRRILEANLWDDMYTGFILYKHQLGHLPTSIPVTLKHNGRSLSTWYAENLRVLQARRGHLSKDQARRRIALFGRIGVILPPVSDDEDDGDDDDASAAVSKKRAASTSNENQDSSNKVRRGGHPGLAGVVAVGLSVRDSFDDMIGGLAEFREEHGDTGIPEDLLYEGEKLADWVRSLIETFAAEGPSFLSQQRHQRLADIGFHLLWDWQHMFEALKMYKQVHGTFDVPESYVDSSGKNLRRWMFLQRWLYNAGHGKPPVRHLSQERFQLLYDIGFDFSQVGLEYKDFHARWPLRTDFSVIYQGDKNWNDRFTELVLWQDVHGHCRVPRNSECMGRKLGEFRHSASKLKSRLVVGSEMPLRDRIEKLNALGFRFYDGERKEDKFEQQWEEMFQGLVLFKRANGHLKVPKRYKIAGRDLQTWVVNQRSAYHNHKATGGRRMTKERADKLLSIGFDFGDGSAKLEQRLKGSWSRSVKDSTESSEDADNVVL